MDGVGKTKAEGESGPNSAAGKHPLRLELSIKEPEVIVEHARSALSQEEVTTAKGGKKPAVLAYPIFVENPKP